MHCEILVSTVLGGQDIDSRIMKYVIDEFKKSSPNYDIHEKLKLIKRLRAECKNAKEVLSFSNNPFNIHVWSINFFF